MLQLMMRFWLQHLLSVIMKANWVFFILARLLLVSLYLESVRDELDILIRTILILYLGWKVTLHMLLMT